MFRQSTDYCRRDISRGSAGCCRKDTVGPGEADAAAGQTPPGTIQTALQQTHRQTSRDGTNCCRKDMSRDSRGRHVKGAAQAALYQSHPGTVQAVIEQTHP